ncbi:MAG: hypothetical protein WBW03_10340 [Silvibacterium sp.]
MRRLKNRPAFSCQETRGIFMSVYRRSVLRDAASHRKVSRYHVVGFNSPSKMLREREKIGFTIDLIQKAVCVYTLAEWRSRGGDSVKDTPGEQESCSRLPRARSLMATRSDQFSRSMERNSVRNMN